MLTDESCINSCIYSEFMTFLSFTSISLHQLAGVESGGVSVMILKRYKCALTSNMYFFYQSDHFYCIFFAVGGHCKQTNAKNISLYIYP